jgi:hypothetical protein
LLSRLAEESSRAAAVTSIGYGIPASALVIATVI